MSTTTGGCAQSWSARNEYHRTGLHSELAEPDREMKTTAEAALRSRNTQENQGSTMINPGWKVSTLSLSITKPINQRFMMDQLRVAASTPNSSHTVPEKVKDLL